MGENRNGPPTPSHPQVDVMKIGWCIHCGGAHWKGDIRPPCNGEPKPAAITPMGEASRAEIARTVLHGLKTERYPTEIADAVLALAAPSVELIAAARALVAAVDNNHETKPAPGKYTVPWDAVTRVRKAIAALTAQQTATAGWRLVPVEMTDEMRFVWASMDGNPADAQWAAVLAAAPNPPSPENVG